MSPNTQFHKLFFSIMTNSHENVNQNLIDTLNYLYDNPPPDSVDVPLSLLSKRDEKWDKHRNDSHDVSSIYQNTEFHNYYERIKECSTYLDFSIDNEIGLKLKRSFFCHVRNCPLCQWRKSLYWKAMMYKTYDRIKDDFPNHRWIFLTLTVQNCHISDLRSTIKKMSDSFKKLSKRKEFKHVLGFVRTTEVTRDNDRPYTHAHPHFHCLLLVDKCYFNKQNLVHQSQWLLAWQECLHASYMPSVDIRAVRAKKNKSERDIIPEILKYALKPDDMLFDFTFQSNQWFIEYTKQVHKMRFVNSGGLLKNALKAEKDITNDDMIALSDEYSKENDNNDKRLLSFSYYPTKRRYIYNHRNNT